MHRIDVISLNYLHKGKKRKLGPARSKFGYMKQRFFNKMQTSAFLANLQRNDNLLKVILLIPNDRHVIHYFTVLVNELFKM